MRHVIFGLFYVTIGIGITAAAEARSGRRTDDRNLYMAIMVWPGTVAAMAYTKWTAPAACEKTGAA
jgi:hypothetical protein